VAELVNLNQVVYGMIPKNVFKTRTLYCAHNNGMILLSIF
jgi:hypothetical protein